MCLQGGYKTQSVLQLGNLLAAFRDGKISVRALRLYLAALVIVAAREAAKRSAPNERRKRPFTPRYLTKELSQLTGCPLPRVRGELRALERAGLLLFGETEIAFTQTALPGSHGLTELLACGRPELRPVPLPRPMLRFLAKCPKASLIQTALAYCVRGLSLSKRGEIAGKGTAKACWIAEATGLTVRSVRSARSALIEIGFITDDEGSKQWKLNRDGAYFTVNLEWSEPEAVDKLRLPCSSFSLPRPQNCQNSSLPYEDMKTPIGSQNPETRQAEHPGVCRANESEEARNVGFRTNSVKNTSLKNIQFEDLRRVRTLKELFAQATAAGWIEDSEASFRNFVGAAVRATRIRDCDPVRVFVTIVRRKLWHHITQDQEARAAEVIQRERSRHSADAIRTLSSRIDISKLVRGREFGRTEFGSRNSG